MLRTFYVFIDSHIDTGPRFGVCRSNPPEDGGVCIDHFIAEENLDPEKLMGMAEVRNGPLQFQFEDGRAGVTFDATQAGYAQAILSIGRFQKGVRLVTSQGAVIG